jgi:hypothetical protein
MSNDLASETKKRIHRIQEIIFTLNKGLDEVAQGYRFADKFGELKIKQLISARDSAIAELRIVLDNLKDR